jgi:hypothetical protein
MILRFALLFAITASLGACASKKSSARVYEGDAPTIHFQSQREAPGAQVRNQTFH